MKNITLEKADGVAMLTLNRPAKLNAINEVMLGELNRVMKEVGDDKEVRVLVVTGAGRAFCAGGDFRYEAVRSGKVAAAEAEDQRALYQGIRRGRLLGEAAQLILGLRRLDKPVIAMVNGDAVGGGLDLALACDLRVGSSQARFSTGFIRIALTPDTGATWLLPRLAGLGKALEYLLTGDFFSAEEAFRVGLLNRLVAPEELEKETMDLARRLARGPAVAQRLSKMQVYQGLEMDLEAALGLASTCLLISSNTEDHQEGVRAFAEKRPPAFRGR
ncbi:MAG: hypothetical protein HW414_1252 [Dehalococcoidia bacterium]|nr:hypothetical protein [Dehalococcoidia bacterium]